MSKAAISAGSATTANVGARVLADGGNAVDAAIAAAFVACVAEPGVASIGGGGFLLIRDPDGQSRLLDFFTTVPSGPMGQVETATIQYAGATQDFHVGAATIAVPGCLDGFVHAARTGGTWPIRELVEPARQMARDGVRLEPAQAHAMSLIEPVLMYAPDMRVRMAPEGTLLGAGEIFVDVELADFLQDVAHERITGIADLVDNFAMLMPDGPISAADLRDYRVIERQPLVAPIRFGSITTNPPPSLGGSIVAHVLADLADFAHPEPIAIAEALVETTAWLKAQATGPVSSQGTTHISVIDADGMCASLTLSNGLGAGLVLPGTGIHLNNMMGEHDLHPAGAEQAVAGTRIMSMMAPTIVEFDDGLLVLGTGGSERIRSALTRVITLVLGGDADLAAAVEAPRVHVDNSGVIQVEPGYSDEQLAALAALGEISLWPDRHFYFGGVNAVQVDAAAVMRAHADPRRGGAAIVL